MSFIKMNKVNLISLSCLAILPMLSIQVIAACDSGFTTDSSSYSLDAVEDFESAPFPGPYYNTLDFPGITVSSITSPYLGQFQVAENCGASIPMDTRFLQTFGDPFVISPKAAVNRLGLQYSLQDFGINLIVNVLDSNGASHSCEVASMPVSTCETVYNGNTYYVTGLGGFVGFETSDPSINIVSMSMTS